MLVLGCRPADLHELSPRPRDTVWASASNSQPRVECCAWVPLRTEGLGLRDSSPNGFAGLWVRTCWLGWGAGSDKGPAGSRPSPYGQVVSAQAPRRDGAGPVSHTHEPERTPPCPTSALSTKVLTFPSQTLPVPTRSSPGAQTHQSRGPANECDIIRVFFFFL